MSFEVFRPIELSFAEATLWFNNSDGRKVYTWNRLAVMSCCGRLRLPGPFDLVSVGSGAEELPKNVRQINIYIGKMEIIYTLGRIYFYIHIYLYDLRNLEGFFHCLIHRSIYEDMEVRLSVELVKEKLSLSNFLRVN
jgi:hypothetical protein